MEDMFSYCSSLTFLDLSNFDTNNVEDMEDMFKNVNKKCQIISNDKRINQSCYIY